ncbi:MAG: hypothetical protein O3C43_09880 [Verrucomicrobia bacterium]|nr:hypothetical protein [Verrucomicrobiota bacterium]MDA1066800.1 hypothetical protein [Verrucomicrobiota bacterium]
MSTSQIFPNASMVNGWLVRGLVLFLLLVGGMIPGLGKEVTAYAKPKEDYIYIYTLENEYETTLFRSEQFEPILETEDGFIVMMQLGGKPKLVLLPLESRDRKVAERKHKGVGVTYTAYLSFTEGYLPFSADKYYEVVKKEKGNLFVDYHLKGFSKIVEVPESQFLVKSGFDYHLEESLAEVRQSYSAFQIRESHPSTWKSHKLQNQAAPSLESPTHVGLVETSILAGDYQTLLKAPATDIEGVITEIWVNQQKLLVVPVLFTHETEDNSFYFVKMRGFERPVLINDFKLEKGSDGYSKVVRVASLEGGKNRFLEITENTSVEFYPNFHFLSPGEIIAVRKGYAGHYLAAKDGEYGVEDKNIQLTTPRGFMQMWRDETIKNDLSPGDSLYEELLKFEIPAKVRSESEWSALENLKTLAAIVKEVAPSENADVHALLRSLMSLELKAGTLGLSLQQNPQRSLFPAQYECYFWYWEKAFNDVNGQAAHERNQDILRKQILRSKILVSETQNPALVDFLSSQIYTYSNFLPAPLNRINYLESDPPVSASKLMVFDFPLDQCFKLNPGGLEPITIDTASIAARSSNIKESIASNWLLDIDALGLWQKAIIARLEEVQDPAYWLAIQEKAAAEKERKLEIARQRVTAAKAFQIEETSGLLNRPEAPWVAAGSWLFIIMVANTGFFALRKAAPPSKS